MVEPERSADPCIRAAFAQYRVLCDEEQKLSAHLRVYVQHKKPKREFRCVPALQHYALTDNVGCGCDTCSAWLDAQQEYVAAVKLMPKGHKWSTCTCNGCRFIGRVHLNFLAATNRRDLLIEMSYYAQHHSYHGSSVMAWLSEEMTQPSYTVAWCAQELGRFPVAHWLAKCHTAVSAVVSGAVFHPEVGANA